MADQVVDDVTKVNPSIPSSLDPKIPVLIQFKNRFDSIDPILFQILMKINNDSYMYNQLNTRDFVLYDLVYATSYLKNTTVSFILILS